jgi:hypothetical protein
MSFITGTQAELLYALAAPVTKNTYTTEAAFSGVVGTNTVCTLDGGYFRNDNPNPVGRSLYLVASGTIANTAAATFAVNLGLDTAAGTKANSTGIYAASAPTASVTSTWMLEAWYTCTAFATSTMSLQVNGRWTQEAIASGGVLGSGQLSASFNGLLTGVNPRADLYIELFGTWNASSASNTTTLQEMFLFGLN